MSRKATNIIVSVLILILLAGGGVMGYLLYRNYSKAYKQSDMDKAIEEGQRAADEYKAKLQDMLNDLIKQVEQSDSGFDAEYNAIKTELDRIVSDTEKQLGEQDANLAEIAAKRLQSLKDSRASLQSLRDIYASELTGLNEQLSSVNADIERVKALEGDHTAELVAFEGAKSIITTDISNHNANISQIDAQLAEADKLIAELEAMQTPAGA